MTQENPQEKSAPVQKFFRTPYQKLDCRTYEEAKSFVTKALEATGAAKDIHKAKVFARSNGLFDAVLYVDRATLQARTEKAFKATPKEQGEAAVKQAKKEKRK